MQMESHGTKETQDKKNIRYWQFEGGYAQAWDTQLRALLEGYRLGHFRRNEVRVFAARLEFAARHPNSKQLQLCSRSELELSPQGQSSIFRTRKSTTRPESSTSISPRSRSSLKPSGSRPRERSCAQAGRQSVLRHIATGGATTVEALFCFAYFMRRIPQRKPMQRLLAGRAIRPFRYADFQEWTGVHRATQCRMLRRLIERGYLNTVPVSQQNANAYGQLFVDGPVLSLVRRKQASSRRKRPPLDARDKRSTPRQEKVNAPLHKRSTLINVNLKKEIEEEERFVSGLKDGILRKPRRPGAATNR